MNMKRHPGVIIGTSSDLVGICPNCHGKFTVSSRTGLLIHECGSDFRRRAPRKEDFIGTHWNLVKAEGSGIPPLELIEAFKVIADPESYGKSE